MTTPHPDDYPALAALIGGWFHQDLDLGGDDLPEIVARAARIKGSAETAAILDDIERFLAATPSGRDAAFLRCFEPGIDPGAWYMDATTWLAWLERELRHSVARE